MVEGTPLLRAHLGKTRIQGSNPCVSASKNDETRMDTSFAGFLSTFLTNLTSCFYFHGAKKWGL